MKSIKLFCLSFCVGLLFACSNSNTKPFFESKYDSYITEKDLPPLQTVNFEKIELPEEECMSSFFQVYKDSILIVEHNYPDPYFLSLMNLNTKKIIGRYFRKGNGPNEYLYYLGLLYDNKINVMDAIRKQVVFFDMDSAIMLGDFYKPRAISCNVSLKMFNVLPDSTYIFYNAYHLKNCGYPANEQAPELLISNDGKVNYEVPEDALYVSNQTGAFIVTNKSNVFLAYMHEPKFVLLNYNLDTVKIIYGPDNVNKHEYYNREGTLGTRSFVDYAAHIYSTDSHILVSNRRIDVPNEKFDEAFNSNEPEIFIFDWDANVVGRVKAPNGLRRISFSESTNTLYITSTDEYGELALYKAKI